MLEKGMYVRCPMDQLEDSRSFVCGQLKEINRFTETVKVEFKDPFGFKSYYENIPQEMEYAFGNIKRCTVHRNSVVEYCHKRYTVVSYEKKDDWYYYTIVNEFEKRILQVREDSIVVPFSSGKVSPVEQLRSYEFQNPAWYLGRTVVSRTQKILENSVFGFNELAGCKIYLMPHQLKTIMRCLQNDMCRYMLADEVGMGKTIEAASVLKVYLAHHSKKRVLIAVPRPLVAQWKTELFIKFEIIPGIDGNENYVELIAEEDVHKVLYDSWDFVIADEAHKLLNDSRLYNCFHYLSKKTHNILLLSATPVQQKREAYLSLLQLILPDKYDSLSLDEFEQLVSKQKSITKSAYLVLQDYDDYVESIEELMDNEENPVEDEDSRDLYDDIVNGLKKIKKIIEDDTYAGILSEINFESSDFGKSKIQEALLYVCENYQLEKNIIRNRRRYMTDLAQRTVAEIDYALDPEKNTFEYTTYDAIVDWIVNQNLEAAEFEKHYIPLLTAFFSSSWAFQSEIQKQKKDGLVIDEFVEENAKEWLDAENKMLAELDAVLAEPYNYSSRILNIIDFIDQEISDEKVVLFTNYAETFEKYGKVLESYFGEERVAFFNKRMNADELELNVYRFQNDSNCTLLLCDESGGEGRNLQSADYIVHIDMPWDANAIEQRIGRLDRLGRPADKDVCSVVIYGRDTLEEELYKFWNNGLNIFQQSLSGLEIIMKDINDSIIRAVTSDFRYGISNAIAEIIDSSQKMEKEVREEQHFDTAAFIFDSLNKEIDRLLKYYTENENELFANTMMGWANLAGLKGTTNKNSIVRFNERSFSVKSAENSLLIPPNWVEYLNKSSNSFSRRIRELYEERQGVRASQISRDIVGTFKRNVAIANDYIHFFAPGDEIFDCIVDNAMKSYKGTCAAMAVDADFDWVGIVYTWTLYPNEKLLIEKNIPLTALRQYKNYISVDQISTPVSYPAYEHVSAEKVNKLLERIAALPVSRLKDEVAHLGRRSKKSDFVHIKEKFGCSNLDWFKERYKQEQWHSFINYSLKEAREQARQKFKKSSNIKSAAADINRTLNAEIAQAKFFGINSGEIEQKRETYDVVLEALKTSKFELESAAFVWVRDTNG